MSPRDSLCCLVNSLASIPCVLWLVFKPNYPWTLKRPYHTFEIHSAFSRGFFYMPFFNNLQQSTYAFRVSIKGENFLAHSSTVRMKSACYTSADTHKTVKWYFSSPVINIYGLTNWTDTPNSPRRAILGTLSGTIVSSSSFFQVFLTKISLLF